MEENSKLKKIIDLYVDKGLNNEYLHDEIVKAFANASPEEKKEGSKYLNWRLHEVDKKSKKGHPNKSVVVIIFIVLIIVIVSSIIAINNNNLYNNSHNTNSSGSGSYYNTTTNNSTYNNSIKHYCDASGCMNEGTYSLKRSDGSKEYYCYKHYKQMENWAEMIMGY